MNRFSALIKLSTLASVFAVSFAVSAYDELDDPTAKPQPFVMDEFDLRARKSKAASSNTWTTDDGGTLAVGASHDNCASPAHEVRYVFADINARLAAERSDLRMISRTNSVETVLAVEKLGRSQTKMMLAESLLRFYNQRASLYHERAEIKLLQRGDVDLKTKAALAKAESALNAALKVVDEE